MRLGLSLHLTQEQSQKMTLEQRQEMVVQMQEDLARSLGDGPASPAMQYDNMVAKLTNFIPADIAGGLAAFLLDTNQLQIKNQTLKKTLSLSRVQSERRPGAINKNILSDFVVDCFWDFANLHGGFHDGLEEFKTKNVDLQIALRDPRRLEARVEELTSTAQATRQATEGLMLELREARDALTIAVSIRQKVEQTLKPLLYAYSIKDENGRPIINDFLRTSVVLDRLLFVQSDRIQKRFADHFAHLRKSMSAEQSETAALNSIGEYVLASMGVISPEIFTIKRGETDEVGLSMAREQLWKVGINLNTFLEQHKLHHQGNFMWSRYALNHFPQNRENDQLVRKFIVERVRQHRKELLDAINFPDLRQRAIAVREQHADIADRKLAAMKIFAEATHENSFREAVRELLQGKMYDDMVIFLTDANKSA